MTDQRSIVSTLPEHAILTWFCATDDAQALEQRTGYLQLLSDEERRRYEAFRLETVKWEFLLAHALLRRGLSRFSSTAPAHWSFATERNGKPCLAELHREDLQFNLSHTRGWVAVSVAQDWKVGVDVQHIRERSVELLARRVLAPWEQQQLDDSENAHQDFFRFWTLKEAYLKATGVGLSTRLESFGFELGGVDPRIRFAGAPIADGELQFYCREYVPGADVRLAVAGLGEQRLAPRFEFEYSIP